MRRSTHHTKHTTLANLLFLLALALVLDDRFEVADEVEARDIHAVRTEDLRDLKVVLTLVVLHQTTHGALRGHKCAVEHVNKGSLKRRRTT